MSDDIAYRSVVEWATRVGPINTRHLSLAAAKVALADDPTAELVMQTVVYSGWQRVPDGGDTP